jgi:hypothetical protein
MAGFPRVSAITPAVLQFNTMNKLINTITNTVGKTLTENGALTNDKSGSKVLDLFSLGGALRSRTDADILSIFVAAFDEDPLLALKTLFYLRDIRGGQGERKVFRLCIRWIASTHSDIFVSNLDNIVKFGRWDDMFEAFGTPAEKAMVNFIKKQLAADARAPESESISLLAKWMPSINTSSEVTRGQAHQFSKAFKFTSAKYRKTLSALRARLNLVETLMSGNEWSEIDFETVPSKANLNYKKAFSRHEADRYIQFIKDVQSGEKKMNASALYPYEIIRDIEKGGGSDKEALDALWNSLPDFLKNNPHNGLVLPDVSGSMSSAYGTTVMPIWVSVSLAIYFAQRNKGAFKDYFLEFSSNAVLRRLVSKNIVEAWEEVSNSTTWCNSTNLQSAFDVILNAAIKGKVPAEEMPSVLYIISDMEFDQACSNNRKTNFDKIKQKYGHAGYQMPVICFWNVAARSNQSPVTKDENGTIMVSGCSPSIFSQVISNEIITPYEFMLQVLNKERYNTVVV